MSEGWNQEQATESGTTEGEAQGLTAAAAEFRRSVTDVSERLSNAGAQLVSMSEELSKAIGEAKQASEQAQAAQRKAEEIQEKMTRDYGAVSGLVQDLQERIGALAVLARPLAQPAATPAEETPAEETPVAEASPDTEGEALPVENQPESESTGGGESPWSQRAW